MRHIPRSVTLRIAFAVSALMCAADSVIAQAYPVKWTVSDFNAGGAEVMTESLEIAHQGMASTGVSSSGMETS